MRFPQILRYCPTMKLEPKSQIVSPRIGPGKNRQLLEAASRPELDSEQVRQRASRISGVLKEILDRRDSPEHISLG